METLYRLHQHWSRYDAILAAWGGALLGLTLRCYLGWQFFKAGLVKVSDWDATLALFHEEYSVPLLSPELAAGLAASGELLLPLLLWVGLVSRPAALGLLLLNATAVLAYPQLFGFDCPAALNDHFYWGALLLALVVYGPGRLSCDAGLAKMARAIK